MKQQSLAMAQEQGVRQYRKPTRRGQFLETMNRVIPWEALRAVVEPYHPKKGNGRPPLGLERMPRIHFLQHWFNPADLACEEALYDSASLRRFAGIDVRCEAVPDATTMLEFLRLLEQHHLAEWLFAEVGRVLQGSGMTLKTGTIVDATLIAAPSSTKNADKQRDPEMHQTRKGKKWYARVEHVFAVAKRLRDFTKVRYRGLAKNAFRAFTALALTNLSLARHRLVAPSRRQWAQAG
jgi:IS5 family transposase